MIYVDAACCTQKGIIAYQHTVGFKRNLGGAMRLHKNYSVIRALITSNNVSSNYLDQTQ